jgi:hypothetical protein
MGVHKIGNTLINLASNCATQSSNLGMDTCFTGDTLDFEHRSRECSSPFVLPERIYTQALNALSDASEKPLICLVVISPLILTKLGMDMLFSAGSRRYSFFHVS